MDFNFTEEQTLLRDTVARFLNDKYDFETRRVITRSDSGWRADYWRAFAEEIGILGASFSETDGGLGGGAIENMIVMEELGKALVIEPYLETVVVGGGFLKHSATAQARELIPQIIDGTAILAFAYAEPQSRYNLANIKTSAVKDGSGWKLNGHKCVVSAAPWATHLIVTARTAGNQMDTQGISVFLIDKKAKGVLLRDYPTVDGRRASEVYFENVAVSKDAVIGIEGQALSLIEHVIDEAIAAICAEAVGCLRKLHEGTLDYSRQRKQFGAPIGTFQVLQHAMVDMFMNVEQATSMAYMASLHLGDDVTGRALAVSSAKAFIGKACKFVGQHAIQIHGGMGMTDELAIGHYFKRTTMIENLYGNTDYHLRRCESLTLKQSA